MHSGATGGRGGESRAVRDFGGLAFEVRCRRQYRAGLLVAQDFAGIRPLRQDNYLDVS
ncbi:hypothetical protein AB0890_19185 [Streptomyces sp. NPDC005406]|uniref:hypothetical protein n=1 Tax=Streptomyces sp. NPDC005406 TaxID=3155339 RepID=UPI0034552393